MANQPGEGPPKESNASGFSPEELGKGYKVLREGIQKGDVESHVSDPSAAPGPHGYPAGSGEEASGPDPE